MAYVLTFEQGALGINYTPLVQVSAIAVFEGGRVGMGMVGLQLGN